MTRGPLLLVLAGCLGGCAVPRHSPPPEPAALTPPAPRWEPPGAARPVVRDLAHALAQTKAASPELRAAEERLRAAAEAAHGASLLPAPVVSLRVESMPLDGSRAGDEWLIGVSQPLPLGGQIGHAVDAAEARRAALAAHRDRVAAELEARLHGAYAAVLSTQLGLDLAKERSALAQDRLELLRCRLAAGDATPVELAPAQLALVRRSSEEAEIEVQWNRARAELAALVDAPLPARLEGSLDATLSLPDAEEISRGLAAGPAQREATAAAAEAEALARLAASHRLPTVDLELFYRRRSDDRDAFDLGISLPLPWNGSTASRARAARMNATAAAEQSAADTRDRQLAAHALGLELVRIQALLDALQECAVPAAEDALRIQEQRWRAGDIPRLEWLQAREDLLATRLEVLATWADLLAGWATLRSLAPATANQATAEETGN